METFISKNTHLLGVITGWGNGYVIIPIGHHLHGKHYNMLNNHIDVHCGLTYSNILNGENLKAFGINENHLGKWMVGFDTCHSGDNEINWSEENVKIETEKLKDQLMSLQPIGETLSEILEGVRDYSYSIEESEEKIKSIFQKETAEQFKTRMIAELDKEHAHYSRRQTPNNIETPEQLLDRLLKAKGISVAISIIKNFE